jgi:hypothetical protein
MTREEFLQEIEKLRRESGIADADPYVVRD